MMNLLIRFRRFINSLKRPSKKTNMAILEKHGESLSSFMIREMVPADLDALIRLHVETWKQTYPNYKNPPGYEIRSCQWLEQMKITDGSWFCFVAVNEKNELVGFIKGRKYQHSDLPQYTGEIHKIYLLRDYQRLGLGKKLLEAAMKRFISMKIYSIVLFGEAQNPSGAFHEAMGAKKIYDKKGKFHGAYGWKDIR